MFIVDYTQDYNGRHVKTQTFSLDVSVINFIAELSENKDFEVKNINKYESGKLTPYSLEIKAGRIVLSKEALEEKYV